MTSEELEARALRLDPQSRARLARRLLDSLETLSPEESANVWLEESRRRDQEWENPGNVKDADDVLREARKRLG